MKKLVDLLLGPSVRRIAGSEKTLYLSFDDGPDPLSTERVLDRLGALKVVATFFVVGQRAAAHRPLIERALTQGHAFGNHSWDHSYSDFFKGERALSRWIDRSESSLEEILKQPTVGFRPPAGVRTPELARALRKSGTPLVLWQKRFFDTSFGWPRNRAIRSLDHTPPGSIILLHDRVRPDRLSEFLDTLDAYVNHARELGFEFRALSRELCNRAASR